MTRSARLVWAFAAAFSVGVVPEIVRAWPSGARGGVIALVILYAVAFTAVWALALAASVMATATALERTWPRRDGTLDLTWLPLVGPAAWLLLTLGERLSTIAGRMFVRQDLAAAVVPIAMLLVVGALALGVAIAHRALAPRLGRLAPRWLVGVGVGGSVLALAAHLARFPVIFTDALAPVAAQLVVAGVASVVGYRLARRGPGRRVVVATVVLVPLLGAAALLAERVAPRSAPAALAAISGRGLAAARVAPLLQRALGVGDADGDGFTRFAGGDCDDGDARVHPYAVDVPDDGVDQDCFEGDLAAAAIAADAATRAAARARAPRARAQNLVLITVDAMRGDAPGFAAPPGRGGPPTPTMDALAARGAVFTRAYSQAPMTRRAFPALLASRYPSNVTWMDLRTKYPYTVSHDANLFLAEVARDAGLATTSVVAFSYARNSRFNQGFAKEIIHKASASPREINADKIAGDGAAQLAAWAADPAAPRFFLWLHFYDAHMPYVTHPGIAVGKSEHERYQGELAWIDSQLAKVMATLESTGLAATTAVAFTGDHGEEFGEHGGTAHGDLYVEDLHVPLVLAGPGIAPRTDATPVGLVDVAPTLAELLGLAIPPSFDGASLVPLLEGSAPASRDGVFSELIPDKKVPARAFSFITERFHVIVNPATRSRELFDLQADPTEQRNLADAPPPEAAAVEAALRRHLALRHGAIETRVATPAEQKTGGWAFEDAGNGGD